MGQVNFRTSDEVQERWTELKDKVDLKNDELFAAMLSAYEESRGMAAGNHASELAEIQETLTTAVSQMVALLGKDEARRKASILAAETERDALARKLAAETKRADELQRKLDKMTSEHDELAAKAAQTNAVADLIDEVSNLKQTMANTYKEMREQAEADIYKEIQMWGMSGAYNEQVKTRRRQAIADMHKELQEQDQATAWEALQEFQEQEMADAWEAQVQGMADACRKTQGQAATDACNAQKEMQNEPSTDANL